MRRSPENNPLLKERKSNAFHRFGKFLKQHLHTKSNDESTKASQKTPPPSRKANSGKSPRSSYLDDEVVKEIEKKPGSTIFSFDVRSAKDHTGRSPKSVKRILGQHPQYKSFDAIPMDHLPSPTIESFLKPGRESLKVPMDENRSPRSPAGFHTPRENKGSNSFLHVPGARVDKSPRSPTALKKMSSGDRTSFASETTSPPLIKPFPKAEADAHSPLTAGEKKNSKRPLSSLLKRSFDLKSAMEDSREMSQSVDRLSLKTPFGLQEIQVDPPSSESPRILKKIPKASPSQLDEANRRRSPSVRENSSSSLKSSSIFGAEKSHSDHHLDAKRSHSKSDDNLWGASKKTAGVEKGPNRSRLCSRSKVNKFLQSLEVKESTLLGELEKLGDV